MNLHEYQAKEILQSYGLPVPEFAVADSAHGAQKAAEGMGLNEAVLKIQVHAGGRGKAGGVQIARSKDQIRMAAQKLVGMKMVNNQTGPEGVVAKKIIVTAPVNIAKEYYLSIVMDRAGAQPILIASPEGGMDIEEVAKECPDKILRLPIRQGGVLKPWQLFRLAHFMGWKGDVAKQGVKIAEGLAKCFWEKDATMVEINPLVETPEGKLLLLDAKISLDDNALFRHKDLEKLYDATQVSPQEAEAKQFDLAYVAMHGEIGCMVNGAGLAMATMDIIQLHGKAPANFLDVGGSASQEKVAAGFRIILSDLKVKAILVNIFGGIMNCATLAEGVVQACKEQKIRVPIVVRMEGTNVEKGKKILHDSGLKLISAANLEEAARKVVEAVH